MDNLQIIKLATKIQSQEFSYGNDANSLRDWLYNQWNYSIHEITDLDELTKYFKERNMEHQNILKIVTRVKNGEKRLGMQHVKDNNALRNWLWHECVDKNNWYGDLDDIIKTLKTRILNG